METILITIAAGGALLVLLYALWGGIHLLAHYRIGFRQMGCRGPRADAYGNQVCCRTGETCDQIDENADESEEKEPVESGRERR